MSNFDTFLSTLSDEQKEALMKDLAISAKGTILNPEVLTEVIVENKVQLERKEIQELGRPKSATMVNEDFTVTRSDSNNGKQPVRAKRNQWKDTGENREEDFDPEKFEKMGKTARTRPAREKVEVECHVCHKSFKVDPGSIYGEFVRCNRCTG